MRNNRWSMMRAVAITVGVGGLTACWPFDPLNDCEQNPKLECYWDHIPPVECDPSKSNGPVSDACGVFVSSSVDKSGDGSQAKPLKTLAEAVEMATEKGKPVYACAEEFTGSVTLASGISLYGGLDCANAWRYIGATKKSALVANPDEVALTILKSGGSAEIADFRIQAADATKEGSSSIAMLVDSATVELVRCDLVAGPARDGEKGETPVDWVGPTDATDPEIRGQDGVAACMGGGNNPGGLGTSNSLCTTSLGGDGGNGFEGNGTKGDDGEPLPSPNPDGFGLGGAGDTGSGCKPGGQGANGTLGAVGAGATSLGTISITGYEGQPGGAGMVGGPGQGGGGGGGAKGKAGCNGASGGGGGAGGCGGNGGKGGTAGGSSIAIVSLNATLSFEDVTLTTANGGAGGEGGDGQNGGIGGTGGTGGPPTAGTLPACDGGNGGVGGFGGKGGGGRGGHSIGIAYRGKAPPMSGAMIKTGSAGTGGLGEGVSGSGAAGVKSDTQEFPDRRSAAPCSHGCR